MDERTELKIREYKLQIEKLELKIDELEKSEIEAEKSAAVIYVDKIRHPDCQSQNVPYYFKTYIIKAHEAGQAYATAATHEIYRPLVDKIQILYNIADHDGVSGHTMNVFKEFENLNQPAQEEKPGIVGMVFDWTWKGNKITKMHFVFEVPKDIQVERFKKYKLTPIED
jgi:hypothetical protein